MTEARGSLFKKLCKKTSRGNGFPTQIFVYSDAEIVVYADAEEYDIAAQLCQTVDNSSNLFDAIQLSNS